MIDLPTIEGGFSVVLADPAHKFKVWGKNGHGKSAERHYPTMKLEEICALPVRDVVAKDAALFLWMTWPKIFDAQAIMKAWGFRYSGLAWEWIKYDEDTDKYSFGGGYGTRKNLEPCLLGRRGNPKIKAKTVRDFIFAKRREHSRKPNEQFERIELMFDGPYLELFSRERREGWTGWGTEVDRF